MQHLDDEILFRNYYRQLGGAMLGHVDDDLTTLGLNDDPCASCVNWLVFYSAFDVTRYLFGKLVEDGTFAESDVKRRAVIARLEEMQLMIARTLQ